MKSDGPPAVAGLGDVSAPTEHVERFGLRLRDLASTINHNNEQAPDEERMFEASAICPEIGSKVPGIVQTNCLRQWCAVSSGRSIRGLTHMRHQARGLILLQKKLVSAYISFREATSSGRRDVRSSIDDLE